MQIYSFVQLCLSNENVLTLLRSNGTMTETHLHNKNPDKTSFPCSRRQLLCLLVLVNGWCRLQSKSQYHSF